MSGVITFSSPSWVPLAALAAPSSRAEHGVAVWLGHATP